MTETPIAAAMAPGTYIRKRREAAGQTLDQVVSWFADDGSGITRGELMAQLRALESGTAPVMTLSVEPLKGAFPFDPNVYLALVFFASGAKVVLPPICRDCACSEFDPCHDQCGDPCDWARVGVDEAPLCTMCIPDPAEGDVLQNPVNVGGEVRDAA
ncbi:MAG TPA: hypothetical protein VGB57_05550 [Allosphingosinicella sp.]|jgi:hypothetical protein